ncbi:MAG: CHAT domain-containing protein, partial [Acidimicrobiia bacterium]
MRYQRASGVTVEGAVDIAELREVPLGRRGRRVPGDGVLEHVIDWLGTIEAFAVDAEASAERIRLTVPAALGPCALLIQDSNTGRWSWHFAPAAGAVRRFAFSPPPHPAEADTGPAGSLLSVRIVGAYRARRDLPPGTPFSIKEWERRRQPAQLRRFRLIDGRNGGPLADASDLSDRALLLLHDLFGDTDSSFGALRPETRRKLERHYGEDVVGFDHATVAAAPDANADALLRLLQGAPSSLTVDVVAHGRGGLVAAALAERRDELPFELGTAVLLGSPLLGSPIYAASNLSSLLDRWTNMLTIGSGGLTAAAVESTVSVAVHLAAGDAGALTGVTACAAGRREPLPPAVRWKTVAAEAAPQGSLALRLDDARTRGLLQEPNDLIVTTQSASAGQQPNGDDVWLVRGDHHSVVAAAPLADLLADQPSAPDGDSGEVDGGPESRGSIARGSAGPVAQRTRPFAVVPRSRDRGAPLRVEVVHGGIELRADTVLVGHFRGSELAGAEASIDVRVGGRMSIRHLARLYPEDIGDSVELTNTIEAGGTGAPAHVVVIGLDDPGRLTATKLAQAVTAGVLRHAIDRAERRAPTTIQRSGPSGAQGPRVESIRLSSVMPGLGGPSPLTVEESVVGLVEGTLAANARLQELRDVNGRPLADRVRITDLAIVQRHADLAHIGAHVVRDIADRISETPSPGQVVGSNRLVDDGPGGWPARLAADDDPGWYRVVIEGVAGKNESTPATRPVLTFTLVDRRAQADRLQMRPDAKVTSQLLSAAFEGEDTRQRATAGLFLQLVPLDARTSIASADNLQFVVNEHSAQYPWELLAPDRGAGRPIGLRGFIRQFIGTEGMRGRVRTGTARAAVVVGNPPTAIGPLSGATREATAVVAQLEHAQYNVTRAIFEPPPGGGSWPDDLNASGQIWTALTAPHCRILHIAAHGQRDSAPEQCGVVIGPDNVLTADDIRQRDDVPELVFLNCCHLAADVGLAANLAHAFMAAGAQAVIAAGWSVDDAAADVFATRFYEDMLAGATFGAAVRNARTAAYDADRTGLTWAAYQCYGDPGFRLEPSRTARGTLPQLVSRAEYLRQIDVIAVRAGDVGRYGGLPTEVHRRALLDELQALRDWAECDERRAWLTSGAYGSLGNAAMELGDLRRAIGWYGKAVQTAEATAPLRALEQLGNAEIRCAQLIHRGVLDGDDREALVQRSKEHLDLCLQLGGSVERFALAGSRAKKEATMAEPGARGH